MIAIMAGGRASRMNRGVKSIDITKGLMEIPTTHGGVETIIDRTMRLLIKTETISGPEDVLLCVGYKADLVKEKYPECQFLETYDPEDHSEILPAFLRVIDQYPGENQYFFFLGDVVWSEEAMEDFLAKSYRAPMVLYHDSNNSYTECFAMVLNEWIAPWSGTSGCDLVRKVNACKSMPVIAEETKWQLLGMETITPKDCRMSCMEQWIDVQRLPGKTRIYQRGMVDDIDCDEDYARIWGEIANGKYGTI